MLKYEQNIFHPARSGDIFVCFELYSLGIADFSLGIADFSLGITVLV